jgi:hypothetical protein
MADQNKRSSANGLKDTNKLANTTSSNTAVDNGDKDFPVEIQRFIKATTNSKNKAMIRTCIDKLNISLEEGSLEESDHYHSIQDVGTEDANSNHDDDDDDDHRQQPKMHLGIGRRQFACA